MSSIVIPFIGGLAMFHYGMNIMADGYSTLRVQMKKILEVLTQNKLMGIALVHWLRRLSKAPLPQRLWLSAL